MNVHFTQLWYTSIIHDVFTQIMLSSLEIAVLYLNFLLTNLMYLYLNHAYCIHSNWLYLSHTYFYIVFTELSCTWTTQIIFTQMWCVWITNIVFMQMIIQSCLLTTVILLNHTCSLCFDAFVNKFPSHNFESLSSFSTIKKK